MYIEAGLCTAFHELLHHLALRIGERELPAIGRQLYREDVVNRIGRSEQFGRFADLHGCRRTETVYRKSDISSQRARPGRW